MLNYSNYDDVDVDVDNNDYFGYFDWYYYYDCCCCWNDDDDGDDLVKT